MAEKTTWKSEFSTSVDCRLITPNSDLQPKSLVVGMHGMGQNAKVMERSSSSLHDLPAAFLYPDGPLPFEKKVSENRRQVGRAWYIYTGDQEAFLESARQTGRWLLKQIDHAKVQLGQPDIPVFLMGYSQGGYLGSILAFDHPELFSGLISCCSRMKTEVLGDSSPTPIPTLVIHGAKDEALPVAMAKGSADDLKARGWPVDYMEFPEAGHRMEPEQWAAVKTWLSCR